MARLTITLSDERHRALREAGWYRDRPEPDLLQWLDLVALGTVCDVVSLSGINRALVAQGLRVARHAANPGLKALAAVAAKSGPIDAYQLGFVLGPRVNAGGRIGAADLGARLLSTDDPALAALPTLSVRNFRNSATPYPIQTRENLLQRM